VRPNRDSPNDRGGEIIGDMLSLTDYTITIFFGLARDDQEEEHLTSPFKYALISK